MIMQAKEIKNKNRLNFVYIIFIIFFTFTYHLVWAGKEIPMELPKVEGSKSFDLEIDKFNYKGIVAFKKGSFEVAIDLFKKASNLAKRLRDPSQGIVSYNLALSLHNLNKYDEAIKQFYTARRFARGNQKIIKSELLKLYECGLNPSVPCDKKVPLSLNIEGSH